MALQRKKNYQKNFGASPESAVESEPEPDRSTFTIDRNQLERTDRVIFGSWIEEDLRKLEKSIEKLSDLIGSVPIQEGRVIVIRQTDNERLFSSFKTAFYHSNYHDMMNGDRFISQVLPRHHSNEPIRGETVLFLFIGVSKNVYDSLSMFTLGRSCRIIGGSQHSVPWGIEIPAYVHDREKYIVRNMNRIEKVVRLSRRKGLTPEEVCELKTARAELPICSLMAPFLLEFSEEALITKVFPQRLWERGVAERDSGSVVKDMWDSCCALDKEKFEAYYRVFGPETVRASDLLCDLRLSRVSASDFLERFSKEMNCAQVSRDVPLDAYGVLIRCIEGIGSASKRNDRTHVKL